MDYEVSVILLTYNPNFEKLKNTINSIINQENISIELIIADDGSKKFPYKEIEKYLDERAFKNYIIVNNTINQGTVRNYLSGICRARGKYIKGISPGDFLYDRVCLRKMIDYMETNAYQLCFGKAVYYCEENGQYKYIPYHNPFDLKVYRKYNENKILKNYFLYQDYALGASFVVEKKLLETSLNKIQEMVKYAEDISVLYMLANGEKIGFFDDYIIWYEYGTGISTKASDKWKKILYNEYKSVYELLRNNYTLAKKGYRYNYKKVKNRYLQIIYWLIISPGSIFFWFKRSSIMRKSKHKINISKELFYDIIS